MREGRFVRFVRVVVKFVSRVVKFVLGKKGQKEVRIICTCLNP